MTRLTNKVIICPHCKSSFRIIWEASINTWVNPELIQKLQFQVYPIYETDATTGLGVKRAFQSLAREIIMIQLYGTKESQIAKA